MGLGEPSDALLSLLRGEGQLLILTGAGVSAESGLATFRGPGGLWDGRKPEDLATPEAFAADPEEVWRFYSWRRARAAAAEPNPAHRAIAALEAARSNVLLVTQNVDGLHERAGSRRVVRLHGSLWRLRCVAEGTEFEDLSPHLSPLPPRCSCGALLRPGVVWFGEPLPAEALRAAEAAARNAALVIVAGTSSLVYPAAALPAVARAAGAYLAEVNPDDTPLSPLAHERFRAPAGEVLPRLAEAAGVEPARSA
jgi:NAD-dependent deacetylase